LIFKKSTIGRDIVLNWAGDFLCFNKKPLVVRKHEFWLRTPIYFYAWIIHRPTAVTSHHSVAWTFSLQLLTKKGFVVVTLLVTQIRLLADIPFCFLKYFGKQHENQE
jgi:hypothetical protein